MCRSCSIAFGPPRRAIESNIVPLRLSYMRCAYSSPANRGVIDDLKPHTNDYFPSNTPNIPITSLPRLPPLPSRRLNIQSILASTHISSGSNHVPRPPCTSRSTHCLNSRTTGSQMTVGFLVFPKTSILHLYCTSSFSAQSDRRTGGFRGFPLGSTLIWASRALRAWMGVAGAIRT